MAAAKIAITLDRELLGVIDRWVAQGRYPNRSRMIQAVLREKTDHWKRARLTEEVSKLDPGEERTLAEERFAQETWPGS